LGTNLSVFAGLVLVAYELGQSRAQLEMSASADGTDNFVQAMEILAQDEGLSQLIFQAEHSYEELDQFQRWRVSKYLDGFMTMSEQDFRVYIALGDEAIATTFEVDWRENMARPMYRDYWAHSEQRFSTEFRILINGILEELDGVSE
jgi:hypothetical protein